MLHLKYNVENKKYLYDKNNKIYFFNIKIMKKNQFNTKVRMNTF